MPSTARALCKSLLNDTCIPATGVVYRGPSVVRQLSTDVYQYDPNEGERVAEAGGL